MSFLGQNDKCFACVFVWVRLKGVDKSVLVTPGATIAINDRGQVRQG